MSDLRGRTEGCWTLMSDLRRRAEGCMTLMSDLRGMAGGGAYLKRAFKSRAPWTTRASRHSLKPGARIAALEAVGEDDVVEQEVGHQGPEVVRQQRHVAAANDGPELGEAARLAAVRVA